MAEILHEPKFWVAVAFVLFIALSYKKVSALGARTLDDRSAKIKFELDQARTLREEAEALLADYKQKQAQYVQEAETMLATARRDAEQFGKQAEKDLKLSLDDRMKQAMEKIAREEENAIQDVRNHVVDIALSAARAIIVDYASSASQDDMVKLALSDIERKIH